MPLPISNPRKGPAMFGSLAGCPRALLRSLVGLAWIEFFATIVPGALCASPLIFGYLSRGVPAFGIVALVMYLPSLWLSTYFKPSLQLIQMFMPYEPETLKGGSILPLPAYSPADWALLLGVHAALVAVIWAACSLVFAVGRRVARRGK